MISLGATEAQKYGVEMVADVRHAFKMIGRMPVLAAVVIVSLRGSGSASIPRCSRGYRRSSCSRCPASPAAAASTSSNRARETGSYPGVSWLEYRDLVERRPCAAGPDRVPHGAVQRRRRGRTERTYGLLVSGNYFSALGLRPAAGRFLRADEAAPGSREPVVVVSHEFWQTRLGELPGCARPDRSRQRSSADRRSASRRQHFRARCSVLKFDLFMPATLAPALAGSRELEDRTRARLLHDGEAGTGCRARAGADRRGQDDAAARARLSRDEPALAAEVLPFWQAPHGPQRMLARALFVLQGVMLLLLLAVCGNTANLVLARASARQREIGVRAALGAGPARVVRLLAHREPRSRAWRRGARHRHRRLGNERAARRARSSARFRSGSRRRRRRGSGGRCSVSGCSAG